MNVPALRQAVIDTQQANGFIESLSINVIKWPCSPVDLALLRASFKPEPRYRRCRVSARRYAPRHAARSDLVPTDESWNAQAREYWGASRRSKGRTWKTQSAHEGTVSVVGEPLNGPQPRVAVAFQDPSRPWKGTWRSAW